MIPKPSFTSIISAIFLAYMANALWSIASLYLPPSCDKNCMKNGLFHIKDFQPGLRFILLSTQVRFFWICWSILVLIKTKNGQKIVKKWSNNDQKGLKYGQKWKKMVKK